MSTLVKPASQAPRRPRKARKARTAAVPQQRRRPEAPPSSGKVETYFIYGSLMAGVMLIAALWYLLTSSSIN